VNDRKTLAIAIGAAVGVVAVTATVFACAHKHREPATRSINEIVDQARQTVRKLDEAVEMLRKSAA
jgi:hypothetical protein